MIGPSVPRPTGDGPEARFAQSIWDGEARNVTGSIAGTSVNRTTRGVFTVPSQKASGSDVSIAAYRLKSVQDDYVTVRSWSGTEDGSSDIKIAKEYKLRTSLTSETIHGVANTYTYTDEVDILNKVRTHVVEDVSQIEVVVPAWTLNEIIYAISAPTGVVDGDSNPIRLLLLRSGQWARV